MEGLTDGRVRSKAQGGKWALSGHHDSDLISAALSAYAGIAAFPAFPQERLIDFAVHMIAQIQYHQKELS